MTVAPRGPRVAPVAVALIIVAILVGQELLFRLEFPLPDVVGFNRIRYQLLMGAHPNVQESLRRGLVYDKLLLESAPDGFREIHTLNRYGFRGPDFAVDPAADRPRILLIGDSVTEGQGAPDSATIAMQLGRLMADDQHPSEIINLGVIAASLPHLTVLVRDAIGVLKPRTIVVILYANDLPAPDYVAQFDQPAPRFPRRAAPWWLPRAAELLGRVVGQEPVYRRWPHTPTRFFAPVPDPSNPWSRVTKAPDGVDPALYRAMVAATLNPWLVEQSKAIPGMLAHDFDRGGSPVRFLRRIRDLCVANHTHLVVAYVPFSGVVHPRYAAVLIRLGMTAETAHALSHDPVYRRQNALLATLSATLQIPLADATADLMRAESEGVPQYWDFDTHPRPAGYATIARRIHRALRELTATAGVGTSRS